MPRSELELEAAARRVHADGPISVSRAARFADVAPETIVSWIKQGRRGVHLDATRAGRLRTSKAALFRFSAQRLLRETGRPRLESPGERQRRADAAGEALAAECGRA
jgi:transposase-like protein